MRRTERVASSSGSCLALLLIMGCSPSSEVGPDGSATGGAGGSSTDGSAGAAGTGGGVPNGSDGSASAGMGGSSTDGSVGSAGTGGSDAHATCTPDKHELPVLPPVAESCPGTSDGIAFETAELCVTLDPESQTVTSLRPKADTTFDFAPSDRTASRSGDGYVHLGDLNLRVRRVGEDAWQNASTSEARRPVTSLERDGPTQAAADLAPTLPGLPLAVTRTWTSERGRLVLRLSLRNDSAQAVEVGGLGFPLVFNNILTGRSLEDAHATCSFSDPYIGRDAGYVQVTRLNGSGPALLVLPEQGTSFEAYGELLNLPEPGSDDPEPIFFDSTPRRQTFEGFHQWMVHTAAYAEDEWSDAKPWNPPTRAVLEPGESKTYGLRFVLSESIRAIEDTLEREQRPVTVGVPGYILPTDIEGKLFVHYPSPIEEIEVSPPSALEVRENQSTDRCYRSFSLHGNELGRARLTLVYGDGTEQSIHYTITKPAHEAVSDLGDFLTTEAWFEDPDDPFGRSPSVMTYDREEDAVVTQDERAWVCGLGDDGGATWLAGIMKLGGQPEPEQVAKYEDFVDHVVWGGLQYDEGPLRYGIKRTLFYYEPEQLPPGYYDPDIDWTTWASWSRAHTEEVPRSYNYPHVTALYWTLYRLARTTTGLVTHHPWQWYLEHAYQTIVAMTTIGNQYAEFGLMNGSVFLNVLEDLEREGWTHEASDVRARMKDRADHWATLDFPFGSEMPWDSTGQEEVYVWSRYFENDRKAEITLNAILGYMPSVPHWGYNGSARRYWDFIYGGAKIDRLERMLHHYGSSLNAIPVLHAYRDHPEDFHLLRIGYAGMTGPLSNIDSEGFPSMAFHAFADTLKWEARTGDYGLAFYGHAANTGSYLVDHPELGWLVFGGNLTQADDTVTLIPRDSFRRRVYLAPAGLWLTLDAGRFERVAFEPASGVVRLHLSPADAYTSEALLRVEQPARRSDHGPYAPSRPLPMRRGAYAITLTDAEAVIELAPE